MGGGLGGIQNPTQLDAPSGALKQAEDPLMAHHGGEVALKGVGAWGVVWTCAWAIQVKPQHIDGARAGAEADSGFLPQPGAAAIAGHHQIGSQAAAIAQHHAADAIRLPNQLLGRGLGQKLQVVGGQGLAQHPIEECRLAHQGARPLGISAQGLGGSEQLAAIHHKPPTGQGPVG